MKNKGITLISLVITIIILIILSSIGIYLSLGNNGIFIRAKEAKEITNKQEATDIINLKITTAQMNKYAEKQEMPTLQELADALYEDNEIQYVALESKVANKEKVTVGNKTSIYTKLNDYPYEFEINSSLQLASINGVKVSNNNSNNTSNSWTKYMMNENGYVMGNEEITLPESFTELYVVLTMAYNNDTKRAWAIYSYNILYDILTENKTPMFQGFSEQGGTNVVHIDISKTKLNIAASKGFSYDYLATTKLEVWYK